MLKYVFDKDGNKTDIIVPIEEWNNMQCTQLPIIDHDPLYIDNTSGLENFFKKSHFKVYLKEHYKQIIELINKKDDLTKEEWLNIYDEYFKYYNILNENDINLLFFIRKETLPNFLQMDDEIIQKQINDELNNKYELRSIYSGTIARYKYRMISNSIMTMNEYSFLQFFKTNFRMNFSNSSIKRLQRLPDRNRLFIYDLLTIHEHYQEENTYSNLKEFFKSKKEIVSFLASYLYNNQDAPVYRMYNDVVNRITNFD